MKYKGLAAGLICGVFLVISGVKAEESVYVDLSVLEALGNDNSSQINSGPLFPVIKKAPASKKVQKPVKKAQKKKTQKKMRIVKKADKPIEAAPIKVEVLEETAKKTTNAAINETIEIPAVAPVIETAASTVTAEPVVPQEIPVVAPVVEKAVLTDESAAVNMVEDKAAEQIAEPTPLVAVEPVKAVVEDLSGDIRFADDSSDLTAEHIAQLEALSAGFSKEPGTRIGIFSFNYDNGEDSFRKKRQCLNRAMEVRAYLMDKGFRAFSVKVVNIADDASKQNVVRVEEIK